MDPYKNRAPFEPFTVILNEVKNPINIARDKLREEPHNFSNAVAIQYY